MFFPKIHLTARISASLCVGACASAIEVSPTFDKDVARVESLMESSISRVDKTGHLLSFSAVNFRETMDDAKLAELEPLAPYLVDIDLSRTRITAAGLRNFLSKADSLEMLNLSHTRVGTDWIPEAPCLPNLNHLILFGTPLTSNATTDIPPLKALETLYVSETGLSSADLAKLREAIPDTTGDDFLARHAPEVAFPAPDLGVKGVGENIALHKPVTATSSYNRGNETFPAGKLTDGLGGDTGKPGDWSFWLAENDTKASFTIDLQKQETIALIELENTRNRNHGDRGLENFTIEISDDGKVFEKLAAGNLRSIASTELSSFVSEKFPITPTKARYLKLTVNSYYGNGPGLNEIWIYASAGTGDSDRNR